MDFNDLSFLESDDALEPAWVEYKDDFELLLQPCSSEEQRSALTKKNGRPVSRAKSVAYFVDKVEDWRGIECNGVAVPFSVDRLRRYFEKDVHFMNFVMEATQEVGNFLVGARAADAGDSSPADGEAMA